MFYEAIIVPENPLLPSAYPPRVILEVAQDSEIDGVLSVKAWFKDAQDQGQYQGYKLHLTRRMEAK